MADEIKPPTEQAAEDMEEAFQEEAEAVQEVTDEVVEEIAEEVADAAETAQEAAADAAETVEETVADAVESHPDLTPEHHGDEVYNQVLQRLRDEGHIPSPAIAEEIAGEAEHEVEAVAEEPEVVAAEAAPVVTRDRIRPTSEHFWYRPRRIFGRSV